MSVTSQILTWYFAAVAFLSLSTALASASWNASAPVCLLVGSLAHAAGCVSFQHEPAVVVQGCHGAAGVVEAELSSASLWNANSHMGGGLSQILQMKSLDETSTNVLWKRSRPNRNCLVRAAGWKPWTRVNPPSSLSVSQEAAVQWINQQCGTSRLINGTLSRAGLIAKRVERLLKARRQALLDAAASRTTPKPGYADCRRITLAELKAGGQASGVAFLADHVLQHEPVIISDAGAAAWPANTEWSTRWLRQRAGSRTIHVKASPDGVYEGVEAAAMWMLQSNSSTMTSDMPHHVRSQLESGNLVVSRAAGLSMTLSEFLDWLESRSQPLPSPSQYRNISLYIEYTSLRTWLPELVRGTFPLGIEGSLLKQSSNAWISDGNTLGKLHFDATEGLLSPIAGTKVVTLVPPYANELIGGDGHLREGELAEAKTDQDTISIVRGQLQQSTSMVHARVDLFSPPLACSAVHEAEEAGALSDLCPQSERNRHDSSALLASAIQCRVEPGETLYIPSYWWHEVQSEPGPWPASPGVLGNIAINTWFDPVVTHEFPCSAQECPFQVDTGVYGDILNKIGKPQQQE